MGNSRWGASDWATYVPSVATKTTSAIFTSRRLDPLLDPSLITRSSTGLKNIVKLADDMELTSLEVVYVTRSYMTRHGNGPFPSEDPNLRFEDPTNISNNWQGTLRFGHLDYALVNEAVQKDMRYAFDMENVYFSAAMTCLDQFDNPRKHLCRYQSYGPTRNDVQNRQCRTLPISA